MKKHKKEKYRKTSGLNEKWKKRKNSNDGRKEKAKHARNMNIRNDEKYVNELKEK